MAAQARKRPRRAADYMSVQRQSRIALRSIRATIAGAFHGRMNMAIRGAAVSRLGALALSAPAQAQDQVAEFYKGKQIRIVAASATGGGYDLYARYVARHLGKHVPGNPTVIVQNMPGAGGLAASNHVYARAAKDG